MARQRISYVPLEAMDDDMRREMERWLPQYSQVTARET
jgi:hypothetical protein